jgi:uncharacterized protein YoxC
MAGKINLPIVSKFDARGIGQATSSLDKLGKVAGGFGIAAGAAFAAAAAGAVAFAAQSVKLAAESEAVSRSLQQIAKNSGAFGTTADEVKKATDEIMGYTKSLSNLVGIDDEILNSIVRGWLAVPELAAKGVKGLEKMVGVVADVAAGTGKDIQAVGQAFIKIAGDESTALSKLLRQGIVFTDSQKEMYQSLLDTSGEMAAQNYLIDELGKTYAGAAEAAANPFDVLTQNVANFQEELGTYLLPALDLFIEKMREFIEKHGPEMEAMFSGVGDFAIAFVSQLSEVSTWMAENPDTLTNVALGIGGISAALLVLDASLKGNPIGLLASGLALLVGATATGLIDFQVIGEKLNDFWNDTAFNFLMTTDGLVNAVIDMLNALNAPMRGFLGLMNDVFGTNFDTRMLGHINNTMGLYAQQLQQEGIYYGYTGGSRLNSAPGYGNANFGNMPRFAAGGIVTGPTIGLVGEAGPEAIIPLDRMGSMGTNVKVTINTVAGDPVAIERVVLDAISRASRRGTTRLVA